MMGNPRDLERDRAEARSWAQPQWSGWMRGAVILGFGLALATAASYIATYLVLSESIDIADANFTIRLLLLLNFVFGLGLVALIAWALVRFFIARSRGRTGSRLHVRLAGTFSAIAVVPVIVVAIFSVITFNLSLESWFDQRIERMAETSANVAESYEAEHRRNLRADLLAMANDLNRAKPLFDASPIRYSEYVATQTALRNLTGALVIEPGGEVLARAQIQSNAPFPRPVPEVFERALSGEPLVDLDTEDARIFGMIRLTEFDNAYLYISRRVSPGIISLSQDTANVAASYEQARDSREQLQFLFALGFMVIALLVLLFAVWLGLSAAGRIVSPIGRLVGAAERVSEGDLAARVDVGTDDDEIAMLGRAFNRMTGQLQTQRDELIEANRQYDRRRRFTEAVLAGVTAGVLGLDGKGRITLTNRSSHALLGMSKERLIGNELKSVVPELGALLREAMASEDHYAQGEVEIVVDGRPRNLTAQITGEEGVGEETEGVAAKGWVATFDDVTDLVSAQRMSAWADVARRIAHEIKNPLTPIQLSAERLKRKYRNEVSTDPEVFNQCTDTIVRQVEDIKQMVDEFSAFARMPEAVLKPEDITEVVREAVFLQHVAHKNTKIEADLPDGKVTASVDSRQLNQGMINIIKNAAEAIETRREKEGDDNIKGHVKVRVLMEMGAPIIEVIDNGLGLPKEQQHRLAEPYVTTREKGTGIGLAVVKKIMEDHHGELVLENAPDGVAPDWDRVGARVRLVFPKSVKQEAPQPVAEPIGMTGGE